MFKLIFFILLFYLIFRIIRGFFKGIFVITKIQNQNPTDRQNPYFYRTTSTREKDISDKARILEEDKNNEQIP